MGFDEMGNKRVCHKEHHNGVVLTPFVTHGMEMCDYCDLVISSASRADREVDLLEHVARVHSELHEEMTGIALTPEHVKMVTYEIREGFFE